MTGMDPSSGSIPPGRPVGRWEDLRKRVLSAVVLVAVGAASL